MMRIRLKSFGKKDYPVYELVLAYSSSGRNRYIDKIGTYDFFKNSFIIDLKKLFKFINSGVTLTRSVYFFLLKHKVIKKKSIFKKNKK